MDHLVQLVHDVSDDAKQKLIDEGLEVTHFACAVMADVEGGKQLIGVTAEPVAKETLDLLKLAAESIERQLEEDEEAA